MAFHDFEDGAASTPPNRRPLDTRAEHGSLAEHKTPPNHPWPFLGEYATPMEGLFFCFFGRDDADRQLKWFSESVNNSRSPSPPVRDPSGRPV